MYECARRRRRRRDITSSIAIRNLDIVVHITDHLRFFVMRPLVLYLSPLFQCQFTVCPVVLFLDFSLPGCIIYRKYSLSSF